jgi:glutathione S-transferase
MYTLYGSYASYYTAKARACLRKKGVPFVERLPSAPRFRERVRPSSGSHRIPQLETPDGTVIQDSIEIFDHIDAHFPDLPGIPPTPRQRLAVHLIELFGSEGLVRLAWQYRWFFEGNDFFVRMDFGRSFRPQGSDEELMHYGGVIADRMLSRGGQKPSDEMRAQVEADYVALLKLLETHFTDRPYLLGGHPSNADYSLMGALHAHMGRDPVPLRVMQDHAPRVFRWVEHMLVPEVESPEFFDTPVQYLADDAIPDSLEALLGWLSRRYAEEFRRNLLAWNAHVGSRRSDAEGTEVWADGDQQPQLPRVQIDVDGAPVAASCNPHLVWVTQRSLRHYQRLPADRSECDAMLSAIGADALVHTELDRQVERRSSRLVLGPL